MKHIQKEWYTCDRCGRKFENIPSDIVGKIFKRIEFGKPVEIMILMADKNGYASDAKLIAPNVSSAEINEYYDGKRKHIHLCGKCRKAFDQFMNME